MRILNILVYLDYFLSIEKLVIFFWLLYGAYIENIIIYWDIGT